MGEPRRVRRRRFPVALAAAVAASAAVAACSGSVRQGQGPAAPAAASPVPPVASAVRVPLTVPARERDGALSTRRMLTVPVGWTARVWARVPDARMEAWTPEGDLLVSEPDNGKIVQLRPDGAGTATAATLLAGLTYPQGMAFARLDGSWVLYVAESDQIDRYRGGPAGSAARAP